MTSRLTPQFSGDAALSSARHAHNENGGLAARPRCRITIRCNRLLADNLMPVVMAIPTFLPIVCNLEANAIRALEEGCGVVISVLRIQFWFCGANSSSAKLIRHRMNIGRGIYA